MTLFLNLHFSLDELVQHGKNGYQFSSSEELSDQIQKWFNNFPNNQNQKEIEEKFKIALKQFQSIRWQENWESVAKPIFT